MALRSIARAAFAGALLIPAHAGAQATRPQAPDTLRIEVGSPEVDGRVYAPHAARVLVRIGDPKGPVVREWTNELTLGDSAGRPVMRWVTRGQQASGATYELKQTYDAITLKPYAYNSTASNGAFTRLTIDGNRVRGTKRLAGDTAIQTVDITLDRPGFFAGASDLVPAAVGFETGRVVVAPVWSPAMTRAETRIFTMVGKETVEVEGERIEAWKVEERMPDHSLAATWYLLDRSPYMVYGTTTLPDGRIQRFSEVEIPRTGS
jgi:hypothetical protein